MSEKSTPSRGRGRPPKSQAASAAHEARAEVIEMPSSSGEHPRQSAHVVVAQPLRRPVMHVPQVQQQPQEQAARPAEVFERLEVLSASVVQLEQTAAALVGQLRPVLSLQDADGIRAAASTAPARTAIGEQLNSLDARVRALTETLNDTLQALEL